MKKILSLLLALIMLFALAACGGSKAEPEAAEAAVETAEEPAAAPEVEPYAEEVAEPEAEVEPEEEPAAEEEARSVTVTDMSGDEVTIEGEIESIVNLWPAGTSSSSGASRC